MARPFWKPQFLAVIIGRPNVGKSTLFNTIAGSRIAIVDPTPGVTRDRLTHPAEHDGKKFDLMDTGGIGIVDMQKLEELVELQIQSAIAMANVILFVVNARDGVTPLDVLVAQGLRKANHPVLVLVNKCDVPKFDEDANEFHSLGFPNIFPISAKEKRGIDYALDEVAKLIPDDLEPEEEDKGLKLALVGRRNVGKSSFVNYLAGEERVIVSEVAGTTRDSVEVAVETKRFRMVAIDTAGVRKKSSIKHPVEFYSTLRTEYSIRKASVVVLMIDSVQGISAIEKKIASMVADEFKPVIIAVNKWDLAGELDPDKYTEYINKTLPGLSYAPIVYISVQDRKRCHHIVDIAEDLHKQSSKTWPTAMINKIAQDAWEKNRPRVRGSKMPKIFYATQIRTSPPTFLVFVNRSEFFIDTYRRYLTNFFKKRLQTTEIPFRIILRHRRPERELTSGRKK